MAGRIQPAYPLDVSAKEALNHLLKGLPSLVKLLFRLIKDSRTPLSVKIWIGGTALYILSPLNFSFGKNKILPFKILSYIDDIILILLTLQKTFKSTPYDILDKYWDYEMPIDQWNDLVFKMYTDIKSMR